jgi:hypothetical protein
MKITKAVLNRVNKVNEAINEAINADVSPVECDSTYEEAYEFKPLVVNKQSVTFISTSRDHVRNIPMTTKETIRNSEDFKYYMSYILKCVKKGFKEEGLALEAERKDEERRDKEIEQEDQKYIDKQNKETMKKQEESKPLMTSYKTKDSNGVVWLYYYDVYIKCWTIYSVDGEGNQLCEEADNWNVRKSDLLKAFPFLDFTKEEDFDREASKKKADSVHNAACDNAVSSIATLAKYFGEDVKEHDLSVADVHDIMNDFNQEFNLCEEDISLKTLEHHLKKKDLVEAFFDFKKIWLKHYCFNTFAVYSRRKGQKSKSFVETVTTKKNRKELLAWYTRRNNGLFFSAVKLDVIDQDKDEDAIAAKKQVKKSEEMQKCDSIALVKGAVLRIHTKGFSTYGLDYLSSNQIMSLMLFVKKRDVLHIAISADRLNNTMLMSDGRVYDLHFGQDCLKQAQQVIIQTL